MLADQSCHITDTLCYLMKWHKHWLIIAMPANGVWCELNSLNSCCDQGFNTLILPFLSQTFPSVPDCFCTYEIIIAHSILIQDPDLAGPCERAARARGISVEARIIWIWGCCRQGMDTWISFNMGYLYHLMTVCVFLSYTSASYPGKTQLWFFI